MKEEHTMTFEVLPEHSAASMGSGLLEVLSTPMLVGYMEYAARELMQPEVAEGYSQVGIEVNLQHLAPTAIGETVSVTAKLTEQKGKIFTFDIEAFDGDLLIGKAEHKRAIVNIEKFMANVQ